MRAKCTQRSTMVRKFGYLCIRKTFGNHMTILAPITKQPQQQQSQVRLKFQSVH